MEVARRWCFMLFVFSLFPYSYGENVDNNSPSSLNDLIRDYAFKALDRRRTGVLYKVSLPPNFSSIEASVARLKSGSFWSRGANFSYVDIPQGSIPIPFVKRLVIVYQNLANWSSFYYNMPGYTLLTPVVGFFAYNASDVNTKVDLRVMKDPISVSFPNFQLQSGGLDSMTKCARFNTNGSMYLSEITLPNVCLTRDQGHFSIVIPSTTLLAPSPSVLVPKKKRRKWKVWVIACVCGVVGLVVLGLVWMAIFKSLKRKKLVQMERRAEEGEALGSVWIGGSRMPSATLIRTQPTLETENVP